MRLKYEMRFQISYFHSTGPESWLTNPPGHLWRDKWTALSGPLSGLRVWVLANRASRPGRGGETACALGLPTVRALAREVVLQGSTTCTTAPFPGVPLAPFPATPECWSG